MEKEVLAWIGVGFGFRWGGGGWRKTVGRRRKGVGRLIFWFGRL